MKDISQYRQKFPQAFRLSWQAVDELIWKVVAEMKAADYQPDVLIAVARGGLVPARILADYLQAKYVSSLQMGHWDAQAELHEEPMLVFPLPEIDLRGKRVLVIDDVSDEGRTLEQVRDYLAARGAEIRTFVLVSKVESRALADYCPKVLDDWRWVLFPWSKHEDLLAFTEKVLQLTGGATVEEIIRILESAMAVDIAISEIEKVLYDMQLAGEIVEEPGKVWKLI